MSNYLRILFSVLFTTREGITAIIGIMFYIAAIWFYLTVLEMNQTLHDIHTTLEEINNG